MGKYAEYLMEELRQSKGLAYNDTSKDAEIEEELSRGEKMSKSMMESYSALNAPLTVLNTDNNNQLVSFVDKANDTNEQPITPDDFEKKMTELNEKYSDDPELCHQYMDELMMELLESLGYTAGVDIFNNAHKWYA